jgi:hypothetical protein
VNPNTGDIARIPATLTDEERDALIRQFSVLIPESDEARVRKMNRAQRHAWARKQQRGGR